MNLYESALWREDLRRTAESFPWPEEFRNASFLITGASGLIGSAVADVLLTANRLYGMNLRIYAAGRCKEKMEERFRPWIGSEWFRYAAYDANQPVVFDFHTDYIIHGASNACPQAIIAHPVETMVSNFFGMYTLLEYAHYTGSRKVLFVSSSEVYGRKIDDAPFREEECGFMDLLSPRSSYPSGKRAAETLCASYSHEFGVPAVIARPGHVYGPTASREDNRVSSEFAFCAAEGRDLVLHSRGEQLRSYCYTLDVANGILTVLAHGECGQAYNIADTGSVMTILEMAQRYGAYGGVNVTIQLSPEREKAAVNPMRNSSLNGEKLRRLGWHEIFRPEEGIDHTIQILRKVTAR